MEAVWESELNEETVYCITKGQIPRGKRPENQTNPNSLSWNQLRVASLVLPELIS
jgi:hypothetical protein